MDGCVASIVGSALPGRDVAGTTRSETGDRNETVRVEFADGGHAFCKRAVDGNASRLDRERAVLEYLDADGPVPVPSVLAARADPVPYLVTEPIDGEPLADVEEDPDGPGVATAMRTLGAALADLHAERFDSHGRIVGGGADGLEIDPASWTTVFAEDVRGIREFGDSERFERYVDDVVDAVEANRGTLDAAPAALVHADPNGANCLYRADGVGLLDWEYAHVGDPGRDLHRTLEQQFGLFGPDDPEPQVAALHEGYRARAGRLPSGYADRKPIYEAVRLLGASAFFEEKADAAAESRGEIGEWMDAEMERRLDAIR